MTSVQLNQFTYLACSKANSSNIRGYLHFKLNQFPEVIPVCYEKTMILLSFILSLKSQ